MAEVLDGGRERVGRSAGCLHLLFAEHGLEVTMSVYE